MRRRDEVARVLELGAQGANNCEISRQTGIPRSTVSAWRNGRAPRFGPERTRGGTCMRCGGTGFPFPQVVDFAYAYLLGLYLGDGWIASHRRGVFRLRIYLDRQYPLVIAECEAAVELVMPNSKAGVYHRRKERLAEVGSYSRHWPHLFPQHGPGRKHERRIALEPWQRQIVERHPGRLLRGLIHSDGCRVVNRVRAGDRTYAYPRYFFSNRSHDIQAIFAEACDRLGIALRQDVPWNLSVARREAVAALDRCVGPKR